MKKTRVFICTTYLLIMALLLSQVSFVSASGSKLESATDSTPSVDEIILAVEPLLQAQKQHYTIRKVSVQNLGKPQASGEHFAVECDIVLYMTLKYSKMEELPHIAGLLSTAGYDTIEECRAVAANLETVAAIADEATRSATATRSTVEAAQKLVKEAVVAVDVMDFVDSVSDTFGKEIDLTFPLMVTFDAQKRILNVEGRSDEDNRTFALSDFHPQSNAQMYANGVSQAETLIATASSSINERAILVFYYRLDARDYANIYTSNATSYCSHGCVKMNTAYYNLAADGVFPSNYSSSVGYNYYCHADCANYVSQAIRFGGIPVDSDWKPCEYEWYNVRGLWDYFVNRKQYVSEVNITTCAAGGFIIKYDTSEDSYDHVVMCVLNDTVNRAYSGHTTDVRQCAYNSSHPFSGANITSRYFYFNNNNNGTQYPAPPIA